MPLRGANAHLQAAVFRRSSERCQQQVELGLQLRDSSELDAQLPFRTVKPCSRSQRLAGRAAGDARGEAGPGESARSRICALTNTSDSRQRMAELTTWLFETAHWRSPAWPRTVRCSLTFGDWIRAQCAVEDIAHPAPLVGCRSVNVMKKTLSRARVARRPQRPETNTKRTTPLPGGGGARNEAEQFRRLTEEAREVRDRHREALETIRQEREALRETAETARLASEEARVAAEAARQTVVETVRATADSLNASLEEMKIVEEMRRTLREIRDVNKLGSS